MKNLINKNLCRVMGLTMALLSGMLLLGWSLTAEAADRGGSNARGEAYRPSPQSSPRGGQRGPHQEFRDTRYQHNRSYPAHGQVYRNVPHRSHHVHHGGHHYYYSGGVWYRPYGSYYSVIFPPFGLFVPFLPRFQSTERSSFERL